VSGRRVRETETECECEREGEGARKAVNANGKAGLTIQLLADTLTAHIAVPINSHVNSEH